jgi:hypothetical protein
MTKVPDHPRQSCGHAIREKENHFTGAHVGVLGFFLSSYNIEVVIANEYRSAQM